MRPIEAISRNERRESLNLRIKPLERPVDRQRLRRRTGHEFLGILLSAMRAAWRSSSEADMSAAFLRSSCRLFHFNLTIFSRRFCFSMDDLLAIMFLSYFLRAGPF